MIRIIRPPIQRQGIVNRTQGLSQVRHGGTVVVGVVVVGTVVLVVAGWVGVPVTVRVWLIEVLVAGFVIV